MSHDLDDLELNLLPDRDGKSNRIKGGIRFNKMIIENQKCKPKWLRQLRGYNGKKGQQARQKT